MLRAERENNLIMHILRSLADEAIDVEERAGVVTLHGFELNSTSLLFFVFIDFVGFTFFSLTRRMAHDFFCAGTAASVNFTSSEHFSVPRIRLVDGLTTVKLRAVDPRPRAVLADEADLNNGSGYL